MALVTEIREVRALISVDLDGMNWIRVRKKHFLQSPLEIDDCIDPEEYLRRLSTLQAADCYEAALSILDAADQTQSGIVKKLTAKGYVRPAAEEAAARLANARLINDHAFAERMAKSQIGKPVGTYAIRRKLKSKGLTEDDIDDVMSAFDGEQQVSACMDALEKLRRKYTELPAREARLKLSQALARRGFDWDTITTCLEKSAVNCDDSE